VTVRQEPSLDLSRKQVVRLVTRWIAERRPAAVIRFGEGEGRLLTADAGDPLSVKVAAKKIRRQTGQVLPPGEVFRVKELVAGAFDGADVVGIRGSDSFSEEHKMWVRRIEELYQERVADGREPAYVAHCLINNELRDALPSLVDGQPRVSVVSCRDVGGTLRARYGVPDVRVFQIPSQFIMREVDGDYEAALHDVPMWPEFYGSLRDDLTVREPGEIFLVGAGVFGKDLCVKVRELGGIALDLGSCLDGMADKVTRGPRRPKPYRP
jgi:hypothetical protein